ncbi:hypothetical protein DL770_001548 [Monosporascus sp. CRB-9-2]|nr:hypothetical protein DL770_001548 [Monosporascus sp. CRB-9-2]
MHFKRYRTPAPLAGKAIPLIGAGTSSMDIAREVAKLSAKVYQSVRQSRFVFIADRLPEDAERVVMVSEFTISDDGTTAASRDDQPIPGKAVLEDGRVREGIDHVVVATGYITSYPFSGGLEQPSVTREEADETVVITNDGYATHNLHKVLFYNPDPTLVSTGVSHLVSTFSLLDFQAQAMVRAFAGQVRLRSESAMKQKHKDRKVRFKPGNRFYGLFSKGNQYI